MDAAGTGMLRFGQESSSSPSLRPHRALLQTHTDHHRLTGPRSRSVRMLPRPRRITRDRFHRFYPRDDFTGFACVPCVKTVELERPPLCWVKSAPLKSHEPSIRSMKRASR